MREYIVQSFSSQFSDGIRMYPVFLILIVGIIIQSIKVIIDTIRYKVFYFQDFFSSGGFPSFHTGLASSVTMLVLLEYGIDSALFAVCVAFSLLIAYDAMNLRYEAGQHAHYLNNLRVELKGVLHQVEKGPLKERIGHTPWEVIGGMVFGAGLTFLLYYWCCIA